MNAPLASMLRYNGWANDALLEGCARLSEDQLDLRLDGASGSVRELLLHIVGGQQTFALRTQGRQHEGELNRQSAWPGFDALTAAAARSNDELIAIAEQLDTEVDVDLPYMGKKYRYPRSFFLVHAVEHGVEHRMEVKLTLGRFGVATQDLDAWAYGTAQGYGAEV